MLTKEDIANKIEENTETRFVFANKEEEGIWFTSSELVNNKDLACLGISVEQCVRSYIRGKATTIVYDSEEKAKGNRKNKFVSNEEELWFTTPELIDDEELTRLGISVKQCVRAHIRGEATTIVYDSEGKAKERICKLEKKQKKLKVVFFESTVMHKEKIATLKEKEAFKESETQDKDIVLSKVHLEYKNYNDVRKALKSAGIPDCLCLNLERYDFYDSETEVLYIPDWLKKLMGTEHDVKEQFYVNLVCKTSESVSRLRDEFKSGKEKAIDAEKERISIAEEPARLILAIVEAINRGDLGTLQKYYEDEKFHPNDKLTLQAKTFQGPKPVGGRGRSGRTSEDNQENERRVVEAIKENVKETTPLCQAARQGRLELVQWLIEIGADADIDGRDSDGNTALSSRARMVGLRRHSALFSRKRGFSGCCKCLWP